MPSAIGHGSQSEASAPSCMSEPYPEWCALFLLELRSRAERRGEVNVKLAAELAGVNRRRLYRYRDRPRWIAFREEWDRIRGVTHSRN